MRPALIVNWTGNSFYVFWDLASSEVSHDFGCWFPPSFQEGKHASGQMSACAQAKGSLVQLPTKYGGVYTVSAFAAVMAASTMRLKTRFIPGYSHPR